MACAPAAPHTRTRTLASRPQVAESGVGHCDVNSIWGEGSNLTGLFSPTTAPRPAAEVQRVLARLTSPIRPVTVDKSVATPAALAATAVVAEEGAAPAGVPLEALLPPPEVLLKFKLPAKAQRGDPDADSDEEHSEKVASAVVGGEELGITRLAARRGARKVAR